MNNELKNKIEEDETLIAIEKTIQEGEELTKELLTVIKTDDPTFWRLFLEKMYADYVDTLKLAKEMWLERFTELGGMNGNK